MSPELDKFYNTAIIALIKTPIITLFNTLKQILDTHPTATDLQRYKQYFRLHEYLSRLNWGQFNIIRCNLLYETLQALVKYNEAHFKAAHKINFGNGDRVTADDELCLVIPINNVILEDAFSAYAFGNYNIVVSAPHSGHFHYVVISENAPNSEHSHPHIHFNRLCEGDGGGLIAAALDSGDLVSFYLLVSAVVNNYCASGAYRRLSHWYGGCCDEPSGDSCECDTCSGRCCDTCGHSCQCGNIVCRHCVSLCIACDVVMCVDCAYTCSACEESFCGSCGGAYVCVRCADYYCPNCNGELQACVMCDKMICPSCRHCCCVCAAPICVNCAQLCSSCNNYYCDDCGSDTAKCNNCNNIDGDEK